MSSSSVVCMIRQLVNVTVQVLIQCCCCSTGSLYIAVLNVELGTC